MKNKENTANTANTENTEDINIETIIQIKNEIETLLKEKFRQWQGPRL